MIHAKVFRPGVGVCVFNTHGGISTVPNTATTWSIYTEMCVLLVLLCIP